MALPICTMGPSRPTEPPLPMQMPLASTLTSATCGLNAAALVVAGVLDLGNTVALGLTREEMNQRSDDQSAESRR